MSAVIPGTRVHVESADKSEVLGWGTYVDEMPLRELRGEHTPCILLDTGEVVFGYQCFWCSDMLDPLPAVAFAHVLTKRVRAYCRQGFDLSPLGAYYSVEKKCMLLPSMLRYRGKDVLALRVLNGRSHYHYLLAKDLRFPLKYQ